MEILKKKDSPRYIRKEGIKSYLLASPVTCNSAHLATTLVEIEPGGKMNVDSHNMSFESQISYTSVLFR